MVAGLMVFGMPLPWSSRLPMLRDKGSTQKSRKKSNVGDGAASLESSQRIQSSKLPKLNA
jgi:hypothetical protein